MRKAIVSVVVLALVATAVAQEARPVRQRGRGGPGGPWGPPPSLRQMVDRLDEELGLDDEQRAQIDEIVARHEQAREERRARWRELREALEAGDEERAAELREQLWQQRGAGRRAFETLFDEIEGVLHEDQRARFAEIRERFARRRGFGGPGGRWRIVRELPDAVKMTEEQRAEYEKLLTERRETMRQRFREGRQAGPEAGAGGPPPGPPDFAALEDEFFEQVAQLLDEEQLPLLSEFRARMEDERRQMRRRAADSVRNVISAAQRVRGLTSEQKEALREIERDAQRAYRQLRRGDREGQAMLAAEVKARILKLLDEQQAEEFERNLDRLERRGRPDRGERQGAGRGPRGRRSAEAP